MKAKNTNADTSQIKDIAKFVEKDFLVSDDNSLIPSANLNSLEEFRIYLAEKLRYLLDEKFDMLVNLLYKIDINEEKLNKLFSNKNHDLIPQQLAELIIERQIQKIKFRKLYRDGKI
jgi:hypothetical protein